MNDIYLSEWIKEHPTERIAYLITYNSTNSFKDAIFIDGKRVSKPTRLINETGVVVAIDQAEHVKSRPPGVVEY